MEEVTTALTCSLMDRLTDSFAIVPEMEVKRALAETSQPTDGDRREWLAAVGRATEAQAVLHVELSGYGTRREYVRDRIRNGQDRQHLRSLLPVGANSGPPDPPSPHHLYLQILAESHPRPHRGNGAKRRLQTHTPRCRALGWGGEPPTPCGGLRAGYVTRQRMIC